MIKINDILEGNADPNDIEFGWDARIVDSALSLVFKALNIESYSECLSDDQYKNACEFGSALYAHGKNNLKSRGYDRFIIFGHSDTVANASEAKQYFKNHNVRDVDVDELLLKAIKSTPDITEAAIRHIIQ